MSKAVAQRPLARRDIEDITGYYFAEGGTALALRFIEALEKAYAQLSENPAIGSNRYAWELNLPGLRAWPLGHFPHLIFYVERIDQVDIWRVLHAQRDIPAWLQDDPQ